MWQSHREIANFFQNRESRKGNVHIQNMAVSACVPGPVFGDTVYGRKEEAAFFVCFFPNAA